MKISIITICFNSEAVIRKTIESVLGQDYSGDVEYIIIDGASNDKTVEIAESYREEFHKKKYDYIICSEPDNGIYDAMNKGVKKSTGEIIGLINAGDWYEPIALRTAFEVYESTHYDMFYADLNLVRSNGSIIVKHSKNDKHYVTSRHWNHPTSFITKKTYDEMGLYHCDGIQDDFDFFLRVKKSKKKIEIRNIVLANFVMGGASNSKSVKKIIKRIKEKYRIYRNNGFSPLYIFECIGMEMAKLILG